MTASRAMGAGSGNARRKGGRRCTPALLAGLVLLSASPPALAWELGPGALYTKDTYPAEVTLRPLTLPAGMVQASLGAASAPSSPKATSTYASFDPRVRFGATDDVQLEASGTFSTCTDCSSTRNGLGGGGNLRVSILRTNAQQLTAGVGASAMGWENASGTKAYYQGSVTHDFAAGRFALVTMATSLHGDRPWGVQLSLQPQLQATSRVAFHVATSALVADSRGFATSRSSIPLELGVVATAGGGPARRWLDLGATCSLTNPFHSGPAVSGVGYSLFARVTL